MRAFVVCTGLSLRGMDLSHLDGEFVIGINRYNMLGIRDPDWWVLCDLGPDELWDWPDILGRQSMFLFREHDRPLIEPYGSRNAIYIPRCEHIGGEHTPSQWHLPTPCEYGGGASIALQLAAYLDKNPIILIGADLYRYRGPEDPDINHFDPAYCAYKRRKSTGAEVVSPEDWERLNDRLIWAHEIAQASAEGMGIEILNATQGGALEVYRRVDYGGLFIS